METKTESNYECQYCEKGLVAFGKDRKNGKESYGHWNGRTLHKKCIKKYKLYLELERRYGKALQ